MFSKSLLILAVCIGMPSLISSTTLAGVEPPSEDSFELSVAERHILAQLLELALESPNYNMDNDETVLQVIMKVSAAATGTQPDMEKMRTLLLPVITDAKEDLVKCIIQVTQFYSGKRRQLRTNINREENGSIIPGSWRDQTLGDLGLTPGSSFGSNNYGTGAKGIRDTFTKYYKSNEGPYLGH